MFKSKNFVVFLVSASWLVANTACAHFPWLVRTEAGKAAYFFGENVTDRTYHLPASVAQAEVYLQASDARPVPLQLTKVDQEEFVGLLSVGDTPPDSLLVSQVTFGIYHGARLDYYTIHQAGELPTKRASAGADQRRLRLYAELLDTEAGVDIIATWDGQPLADADVHLYSAQGREEGAAKTDAAGRVSFDDNQVKAGLNGIMLGYTREGQAGKLGDQAYQSESHYLTATFIDPQDFEAKRALPPTSSARQTSLAELPYAITSFGAARIDEAIYVYGGHTGQAHSYSTAEQSSQLLKLDLGADSANWVEVTQGERLQGLAMVAHGNRLIIIGGFSALNPPGAEHDLHSQTAVRAYDTVTGGWSELPALPAGRSSHDAAIVADTIYVVGGWNMGGGEETQWHSTALSLDLAESAPQWKEISAPPFQRRALAVVAHGGKVFAIGGMDQHASPTRAVSVFDTASNSWSKGPELIGEQGMDGFGVSAWSIDGKLVATTYAGDIQQLSADGSAWTVIGHTKDARFFHRLLPVGAHTLVSIGGANMEAAEKYLEPELIELP